MKVGVGKDQIAPFIVRLRDGDDFEENRRFFALRSKDSDKNFARGELRPLGYGYYEIVSIAPIVDDEYALPRLEKFRERIVGERSGKLILTERTKIGKKIWSMVKSVVNNFSC